MQLQQQEINTLFTRIIRDLADDVINDTQSATEETIDIATQFLDTESQKLLESFHQLQHGADCPDDDDRGPAITADVHAGIQEVIRKEEAVRTEVNTVLSAMQFSEMLRQQLEGVCRSFDILTNNLDAPLDELKEKMREQMHTYDERKAYYKHVMHSEMPTKDRDVSQNLIDQLIG